jgi:Dehydrogenase E1 component
MQQLESFLLNPHQSDYSTSDTSLRHVQASNSTSQQDYKHIMSPLQAQLTIDAMLATFVLHSESRVAALIGQGFYTIGPCGEEGLAAAGWALQDADYTSANGNDTYYNHGDTIALHYRHLAINLLQQLRRGASLDTILLDRARGYTVSRLDPMTGGVHCAIGSPNKNAVDTTPHLPPQTLFAGDYVVTSTLASQCPPAVGRALGFALRADLPKEARPVSFVTIGDGSVHNHHFLSAFHLARHARHRNIQCPVVFGIADNGLSISYSTHQYIDTFLSPGSDAVVPVYYANANDLFDVYSQTIEVVKYARRHRGPAVIVYRDIVRRFGHAATDRQSAYLSNADIAGRAQSDVLEQLIQQMVRAYPGQMSYSGIYERLQLIRQHTELAFAQSSLEDKVTRQDMMSRVSAPMWSPSSHRIATGDCIKETTLEGALQTAGDTNAASSLQSSIEKEKVGEQLDELSGGANRTSNVTLDSYYRPPERNSRVGKVEVMRKHMTRVVEEVMTDNPSCVYLGEDVRHGGYYLVTEGIKDKFPRRIVDFPPVSVALLMKLNCVAWIDPYQMRLCEILAIYKATRCIPCSYLCSHLVYPLFFALEPL